MSFEIQNDVPMPSRRNRYPFGTMNVGQSFSITGDEEARKVRNAAYQFAKKTNDAAVKVLADRVQKGELTAEQAAAGHSEVKFSLRKVDEVAKTDSQGHAILDAEGKPVTTKIFRLWRE